MSKQEPLDQIKFLVSCIGHSSNGRPDFQAVADELDIVTKAAAQKRYERMLKAHGISRPGALAANNGDSAETPPATPTKRKAKGEAAGSAKKTRTPRAKAKAKKESSDDEKPKPKASATKRKVKKEEEQEEEMKETSAETPDSVSDAPASDES
ncbi:uncharacterized protein B0J16DRAFT_368584 [Fusarium flagelliforme]|uniref:Myb-like DNA-binding domain-containing protein n=1 Tax=Fusarium flagelliforme TaxID=2675880 RepID=A0A395MT16_9HYPO|nr:uncharacterized protein B0J16DRAFT_368584 [Fusarium flagelliforme]KAH7192323.1 hypothetical protein B0J16DRAFT_368584 [Fusarium flagelliforme]RFN50847.1 hypothetical protein FIE12Z_4867 [Fusarium flagelliforme]